MAGAVGGTVLGLGLDGIGLFRGGLATGWAPMVTVLVVLFGLKLPDAVIRLFFVLPIQASVLVWATGVITFLLLLASLDLGTADYFGTFLGTLAWWHTRGPAGRKRKLLRDADRIQQQLSRFEVLDGGRNNRDDDIYH